MPKLYSWRQNVCPCNGNPFSRTLELEI